MTNKEVHIGDNILKEGDWITMNGTIGKIYKGQLAVLKNKQISKEIVSMLKQEEKLSVSLPSQQKRHQGPP